MFEIKDELKRAVDLYYIRKHQIYNVVQSHSKLWSIRYTSSNNEQGYKWRLCTALLKKHGYFYITRYESFHTYLFKKLSRDHKYVSRRMIDTLV